MTLRNLLTTSCLSILLHDFISLPDSKPCDKYDKIDDINCEIDKFQLLERDLPYSPSNGVYISQLISFARVCSNVSDFNNKKLFLTAKILI